MSAADDEQPDDAIVTKFRDGGMPDNAVPLATLAIVWYIDADGKDAWLSKFDGKQRTNVTIGDLTALIHMYLHEEDDEQDEG